MLIYSDGVAMFVVPAMFAYLEFDYSGTQYELDKMKDCKQRLEQILEKNRKNGHPTKALESGIGDISDKINELIELMDSENDNYNPLV